MHGCATERSSYCRRVDGTCWVPTRKVESETEERLGRCEDCKPTDAGTGRAEVGRQRAGLFLRALSLLAPSCVARLLSAVLIEFSQSDVYRRLLSALSLSSRGSVSRLSLVSPFPPRSNCTQVSHGGEFA